MKNIAIIGNSPAAYAAVKILLEKDPSLGITLISADGQFPYDRMLLPGLIDRSVKEKDIFCAPVDFFTAAQVQVVVNHEISRINFSRNRIHALERQIDPKVPASKSHYDFDTLMILDAPQVRMPALKGIRRQGVFHLATLPSIRELIRYLPLTETVMIEPLGFSGIRAALALKAVGKDVILASRQEALLSHLISAERSALLATALKNRGIRLMLTGGCIEDIIGDNELKAVRFKTGKVVASDMVILEDVAPDFRFLTDTGIDIRERIVTTTKGETNIPGVLALDAAAQIPEWDFIGAYGLHPEIGILQAERYLASLFGEQVLLAKEDLTPRDLMDTFFHPQEIHPEKTEVSV